MEQITSQKEDSTRVDIPLIKANACKLIRWPSVERLRPATEIKTKIEFGTMENNKQNNKNNGVIALLSFVSC